MELKLLVTLQVSADRKLIEYNDTQDYADMSKYNAGSTHWNMYDLQDFSWEKLSTVSDIKSNSITFKASDKTQQELWKNNGTFSIKFNAFGSEGREDQLPHLQYNENLTQFDMNIDHIMTNFTDSRFAVEILTVGGDSEPMYVDKTRSIDDEYAPGVFQIYNWMTRSNHRDQTGFLQWKPVAYNALKRARNKATSMKHYALQDLTMDQKNQVDDTIVYAFYGETVLDKSMKKAQNFSFGIAKDGGYNKTRVLTWSGSIGYGSPPADAISTVVIIIILAGLGLPIVIIIFGGIFVCMKKRSNRPDKQLKAVNSTGYQPILDSDR
ncbi:GLMP-like protein [Mya arenaria]|uniref:GLMP-like protein n=1 Tax=Mya arenaria TaxID=6604 RepID=A0ABY7DVF4_MYAAR|nr:GLMP-like protein [Mya arenaria]